MVVRKSDTLPDYGLIALAHHQPAVDDVLALYAPFPAPPKTRQHKQRARYRGEAGTCSDHLGEANFRRAVGRGETRQFGISSFARWDGQDARGDQACSRRRNEASGYEQARGDCSIAKHQNVVGAIQGVAGREDEYQAANGHNAVDCGLVLQRCCHPCGKKGEERAHGLLSCPKADDDTGCGGPPECP